MSDILIYDIYPISLNGITTVVKSHVKDVKISVAENKDMLFSLTKDQSFDLVILSASANSEAELTDIIKSIKKTTTIGLYYEEFPMALRLKKNFVNVKGLISKRVEEEWFVKSLQGLLNGRQALCYITQEFIMAELSPKGNLRKTKEVNRRSKENSDELSDRETQIMNLLMKGRRTSEIARELNLRMSTISTMKASVLRKLKVDNVIQLMGKAESRPAE